MFYLVTVNIPQNNRTEGKLHPLFCWAEMCVLLEQTQ